MYVQGRLANILSRSWWLLLLRGIAAIIFGILTWVQPGISLATLIWFFGAYALVDGFIAVYTAISGRKVYEDWWELLLGGLIGIGIGFLTFLVPNITALALLFYIAIWAIAKGSLEIAVAIRLRKEIEGEWLFILGGLASVLFGILLVVQPEAGALTLLWLIASYAVVFGILLLILAFRVRSLGNRVAGL